MGQNAKFIRIDKKDNVGTALSDSQKGQLVVCGDVPVVLVEDVRQGHKAAIKPIPKGEFIIKYGNIIGVAMRDIREGEWVHIHNLEGYRGRGDKDRLLVV